MIRSLPTAALAALAIGLAPLTPALAAPGPGALAAAQSPAPAAGKAPPNPCRTFSTASADALMGLRAHTRLARKLTKGKTDWKCTVKHGTWRLAVLTERAATSGTAALAGLTAAGLSCHEPSGLGRGSELCEATGLTLVVFRPNGVLVSDTVNKRLPKKGRRLDTFARAQDKRLKA